MTIKPDGSSKLKDKATDIRRDTNTFNEYVKPTEGAIFVEACIRIHGLTKSTPCIKNATDIDVGALGAVDEIEVEIDRFVVAAQARGKASFDVGEVKRFVTLLGGGLAHLATRQRRHERLGHHPGQLHHRRLADLGGQDAIGDQEDIAVEASSLVAGPHLTDDAVVRDLLTRCEGSIERNHVV